MVKLSYMDDRLSDLTQFRSKRYISCSGNDERVIYSSRINNKGVVELVEVGAESISDFINSNASSVDINLLFKKFKRTSDPTLLQRRKGFYDDITQTPKSFMDMLNIVNSARQKFESLPIDVKEKFGNNFSVYAATVTDPNFVRAASVKQKEEVLEKDGDVSESQTSS